MLNDFEIRPAVYLDGHTDPNRFDVVKWVTSEEAYEAIDWETGKKTLYTRHCFSVAFIWWNKKEPCWEFSSVGTRFLEHYEEGLCKLILEWMQKHIPEEASHE